MPVRVLLLAVCSAGACQPSGGGAEPSAAAGTGTPSGTAAAAAASTGDGLGASQAKSKQAIAFPGSRGDQVPGYLWLPARRAGQKLPAALLMYGLGGSKDDGNIGRVGDLLSDAGIAAITLDWPGTGARGKIANTDRIINPDIKNWTVGDYGAAMRFLAAQPDIDMGRLAYVGASMGAMTGLAFAASEPRIKVVVAVVPIPNPLWGDDDPSLRLPQLAPRPVLCISTADNSDFSASVCAQTGAGGVTKALPGGHDLSGFRTEVVNEATAFLEQHLK